MLLRTGITTFFLTSLLAPLAIPAAAAQGDFPCPDDPGNQPPAPVVDYLAYTAEKTWHDACVGPVSDIAWAAEDLGYAIIDAVNLACRLVTGDNCIAP